MRLVEPCLSNVLTYNDYEYGDELPPLEPLPIETDSLNEDLWSFNFFWWEVKSQFTTVEQLYSAIQDLHRSIEEIKERFRSEALPFPYPELNWKDNRDRGVSGSYFLVDDEGRRCYVVKPLDEDAGCIHSDGFATPFISSPLRDNMPLYRSSMREVLAYQIAQMIGVGSVVPKTSLAIFESEYFHTFSEGIHPSEMKRYLEECGFGDKEKLCSVQEFVQNSKSLFEALHELEMANLTDDEIAKRFDQTDFEDANILLWATYDTDGHMGNFLVYPKGTDEVGNEILGLRKIDNGLAFPDQNQFLRNNLSYLPNAKFELSEEGKAKIASIDVEKLAQQFEKMGLESAIPALRERIPLLQELAKTPGITIKEINQHMSRLERINETDIISSN